MNNQRNNCLNYLGNLMLKSIKENYNNECIQFKQYNENLNKFLNNHSNYFVNNNYNQLLAQYVSEEDYIKILNYILSLKSNDNKSKIQVRNIISTDIKFLPLSDINVNLLDSDNRRIYDEAIQIVNHRLLDNSVLIGIKNNNLVRMIKDSNGKVKNWMVDEKGLITERQGNKEKTKKLKFNNNSNMGFSNLLILSFIVGSFIGILFLSLYLKFVK